MGFSSRDVVPFTQARERIHLLLIDDARRGLADVAAARTREASAAIATLQKHRAAARKFPGRAAKRG